MKFITKASAAYKWLHKAAAASSENASVHYLMDVFYDNANESFLQGDSLFGMELEFWDPFFEGLLDPDNERIEMKKPQAAFLTMLLSDQACRGASGTISVEQAVLMMIIALDWADQFDLRREDGSWFLLSNSDFGEKHRVSFAVPYSQQSMAGLHYSIGKYAGDGWE